MWSSGQSQSSSYHASSRSRSRSRSIGSRLSLCTMQHILDPMSLMMKWLSLPRGVLRRYKLPSDDLTIKRIDQCGWRHQTNGLSHTMAGIVIIQIVAIQPTNTRSSYKLCELHEAKHYNTDTNHNNQQQTTTNNKQQPNNGGIKGPNKGNRKL
jgi:hypothetical protein